MRHQAFGRKLLDIFQETKFDTTPSIAPDVLPLFLYFQHEARERLRIVEQMQEHIAYLQDQIDSHDSKTESSDAEPKQEDAKSGHPSEGAQAEVIAEDGFDLDDISNVSGTNLWARIRRFLTDIVRHKASGSKVA